MEIAVPRREALLGIEHRDTIAHIVEGDAQLGLASCELVGALAKLVKEPGILDRDHRLIGERRDELDLTLGECLHSLAPEIDRADHDPLTQ